MDAALKLTRPKSKDHIMSNINELDDLIAKYEETADKKFDNDTAVSILYRIIPETTELQIKCECRSDAET